MRRTLLVAAVAATALSVAACGGSNNASGGATTTSAPSATTTTSSADAAAAWMDKVCGEILDLERSQPSPPTNLAGLDQQQALDQFDKYVADNIDVVNRTANDLATLGEPPFRGGAQIVNALVRGLAALRDSLQVTKDKFASIDTSNPQQAQAAVLDALESLGQGGQEFNDAVESIQTNKEIEQAIKAAPNCQQVDDGSSTSGTATTATTTT